MPWEVPITVGDQTYPVQFNTESEPAQADIDEAVAQILQTEYGVKAPAEDTGQSRFLSGLSSVGRGALSVIPGAIGGVGYLTEPVIGPGLKEMGEDIESDIESLLPVNPAYEGEFSQKALGAIGQAGGMLFTGGIAGALGKGAAAARGLGAAEAAAAGTQLAGRTLLGSGFLSGSREGGQAAERYGMEGVSAYTRALLGGAIEGATEKYLFGLGTELAPVKKFLGDTLEKGVGGIAKMGATEAGEEAAAQVAGNIATKVLAPEGVETPGIGSGVGEAAALGGVAGLALGGVTGLLPSGEKAEPATAAESVTVESGEMPLPAVLKTLDEKVTAAVEANADVLPATAAALKETAPEPVVEETVVAEAPAAPKPAVSIANSPSPNLAPRATENAPPRPVRQPGESREQFIARKDEWESKYEATHNEDGTPYQPTVLDETVGKALSALKNKTYDEQIDSIGTDTGSTMGTGLTQLLNDGWVWDDTTGRMVDPQNRGETPFQALTRIRGQTAAPETKSETEPAPDSEKDTTPAPAQKKRTINIPGVGPVEISTDFLKSPAAPPAEPTDATEGQPPTPRGVGAPPVVINEPQTPSPAEQPVSAAQTPVATEPETPLPETEKVVAPKAEPEQGAGMTQRDTSKEEKLSDQQRYDAIKLKKPSERTDEEIAFANAYSKNQKRLVEEAKASVSPQSRQDFVTGDSPTKAGKRLSSLATKKYFGESKTPEEVGSKIEDLINAGWRTAVSSRGERVLTDGKNALGTKQLGAIGIEYANFLDSLRKGTLDSRVANKQPVSAEAVDAYGITLPEGYVRQGDLYVFAPEAPAAPAPKAEPEQGAGMPQKKIKDRRDSVPIEDRADYDEFMSLMERRGPAQSKVKGFKFTKADENRFQELGKKLRKYLFETVDPSTDPVIWKDTSGQDIHLSAKGTLYTVEKGRVRTGVDFGSDRFVRGFTPKPIPADFIEKADAADLLPEGYVRQGDLYVFAPEAPPTQTETQPKPEDASKNQVEETGGTPPVESQPPQTRPEGEAQEGASQRGREGEEGVLTPEKAAPGVEPGAAAEKPLILDSFSTALQEAKGEAVDALREAMNNGKGRFKGRDITILVTPSSRDNVMLQVTRVNNEGEPQGHQDIINEQDFNDELEDQDNLDVVLEHIRPDIGQARHLKAFGIPKFRKPVSFNYRLRLREVGPGTVPAGFIAADGRDVSYNRPLTRQELADFEMIPVGATPINIPSSAAPEFGSTNTIFTKEKAEEASKIIKRKLGQTNVPAFDPELFAAATNYAGFLIEGGVRKFGDFSAEMVSRFGDSIRPFIKGVYNGVRDIYAMEGMDDAATVSKVLAGETPAAAPAPAPAPAPAAEAPLPQTQQTPVARPSGEPFAAPTEESRAAAPGQIATARSVIDEERKRLGRPPVEGPIMEAISDEAIYAQAKAEYDKDPEVGNRLVDSLNGRPRAVDSLQQAILGQELVRRRNALDIASDAYIADPKNTQLEDDFNKASARYEEAKFAAQYGISDVGRTLRLARVLLNLDFSKAGLITRFRQASGGVDPNAEQLKKIDELSNTILESEKKVEELRATKEENARLQELLDNMVQDMKDQAIREFNSVEKARKEAKAAFKAAPNKVSALDTLEEKIRARRAERKKKVMADPFLLNALADAIDDVMLGAIKIAKGVRNVAKWMSEMKAENPDYTDEQLQEIRKASENFYENEIKPELGAEAPAAEVVEEETLEDEEGEEGKVFVTFDDVTGRDIYRMVKDRVQKGMTEIGEVMKSVTEEIQKQLPDVTERQVRDRFSGYGKPLFPSQEASAKKVRELRTLAQYASKIEDAQKKIAPLRSGKQRDEATDAIRQAQKELYRLMKENGLEMPPGPRSLKGPLDVIKRRLKNRRDDLQRQMTAGKRDVVSTKKIERDAEAKALEEEIRALDEALDALDPPLPPSYQDKVKDRMRAVDKEIVELRRKIKERDVSKQKPEPIITEQLQVKLNERDALKQALDDLRIEIEGEPQLTQEEINERAERVLDRNIDALEAEIERLKDPNYFPQEAQKAEATPTIIRLRKQQEILREERKKLSEARFGKKVKSESERVDIAIAALEKSIDNINQKILTGDLSPTARKGTPLENAKIKNLRAERNSLRSVMNLMRKAKADAAKDPVAEQIRRDRKYLQSRIEYYENIQKKMADGTYKPKVKEQRKYDESLGKELQKLEDAKMAVADMLLQERLKNRSTLRKAFDFIGDLFGIQRVLTATADISAIGNQGNFILFSNPKIALKAIPDMLRAMKTPEGEKAVQERIRNMPEYKDGELSRVGLYLAMDAGPNSPLSKMEEQYATRLVNKWPKAFGGGIVRGSERAYKTFLDVIRVAAYKSMKETLVKGGWFTPPQEATQERLEALSNLVNNATGRGAFKMKKADQLLSQAAPFLNTFIFAPRFGLSRIAMALGLPLWRAAPGTRALIAQEYAKYAIGVTVASLLLSLAQDDEDEPIVPDPRSTDFLKTRFGDYRVDLLGGFQQPFVFLTRMLTGETVTRKGNVRALRESDRPLDLLRERPLKLKPNYGSADASSVLGDFLRFKLAPTSASILNALNSKDPVGNRTDVKSEILKAPVPLVVGQLVESLSAEDPADAALLSILGLTGIRTSYQGKDADKNKTEWEKMVKKVEELTGIK